MLFLGHIATGLALADATDSDRAAAIAGTMLPDVIDKTAGWVLHVAPTGRWLAHGLPFCGVACLSAGVLMDKPRWRGFALGYFGHLICDLWGGGRVPWLAPFQSARRWRQQDRWRTPKSRRAILRMFGPEVVGAAVIWLLLRRDLPSDRQSR